MRIKSKDEVVSFAFQPEDYTPLSAVPPLALRVERGLFNLIVEAEVGTHEPATNIAPQDTEPSGADVAYLKSIGLR